MNHVFKNLSREYSLSIISSLMLNDVYHEETILFLKAIYFIFKHKEKESDIRSLDTIKQFFLHPSLFPSRQASQKSSLFQQH